MNQNLSEIITKIKKLIEWLDGEFLERQELVRGSILAIMAGEHILILGPPGTAKSLLARTICSAIKSGKYFYYLLTKFTTPEEIFGPLSLKALEEDKFERKIEGYLPTAHIAFLDEIFKASSAILNTLLTIINERKFHMGEKVINVPLISLFGASNELPEENESLEALYDRFLLRFEVDYVNDDKNFAKIALGEVGEKSVPEELNLSLDEIKLVQEKANNVDVPENVLRDILMIRNRLFDSGLRSSDRRWKKIVKILRVSALLNGRTAIDYSDLFLLEHMLWDKPENKKVVRKTIIETLTEGVRSANDIEEKIKIIAEQIFKETETERKYVNGQYVYYAYIEANQREKLKQLFYSSLNELWEDIKKSLDLLNERRRLILNQADKNIFFVSKNIRAMLNDRIDKEIKKLKDLENPLNVLRKLLEVESIQLNEIKSTSIISEVWNQLRS